MRLPHSKHFPSDHKRYPSFQAILDQMPPVIWDKSIFRRRKRDYIRYGALLKQVKKADISQLEKILEAMLKEGLPFDRFIITQAISALGHFKYINYANQLYHYALTQGLDNARMHYVMATATAKNNRLDLTLSVYEFATHHHRADENFYKHMISISAEYERSDIAEKIYLAAIRVNIDESSFHHFMMATALHKDWKDLFRMAYEYNKTRGTDNDLPYSTSDVFFYAAHHDWLDVAQDIYLAICKSKESAYFLFYRNNLSRMLQASTQRGWVDLAQDIFSKATQNGSSSKIACHLLLEQKRSDRLLTDRHLYSLSQEKKLTSAQWLTLTFPDAQKLVWYQHYYQPEAALPSPLLMIVFTYLAPNNLGEHGAKDLCGTLSRLLPQPLLFFGKDKPKSVREETPLRASAAPFIPGKSWHITKR